MPNFESVLLEYQDRLRGFEASFSEAHTKQAGAVALFAAALSIAVLLCFAAYSARRAVPGWNVHMKSCDSLNPFAFDYLVKAGISTQSNALAIVRMAGVPV